VIALSIVCLMTSSSGQISVAAAGRCGATSLGGGGGSALVTNEAGAALMPLGSISAVTSSPSLSTTVDRIVFCNCRTFPGQD